MKIHLHILFRPGEALTFEHRGPMVRIGRDPRGELVLEGEMSQLVSWNHAQIELRTTGARLSDLGSTNGTFVNDRRIAEWASVKVGDQIQLGHTGPTLKVIELDLSVKPDYRTAGSSAGDGAVVRLPGIPPIRRATPGRTLREPDGEWEDDSGEIRASPTTGRMRVALQRAQRNPWIALSVGALCVLLLLVGLWRRPGQPMEDMSPRRAEPPKRLLQPREPPVPLPPPPPPLTVPSVEHRDVGRYVSTDKEPPSIVLLRQREANLWGRLRPDSRIATGYSLVSLPGYRSRVQLDSGVQLTLWGHVPEFSNLPPVLESSVLLHAPEHGIDLDFSLDHGRVHLTHFKSQDEARVRMRFRQEIWELTLPRATEVVLDLWGHYPRGVPFREEPGARGPLAMLELYCKGPARLKTAAREYVWPDSSRFSWSNDHHATVGPEPMPKPPDWWTNRLDWQTVPAIAEMILALNDLSDKLAWTNAILETVLTQVRESEDPPSRSLGVLCLAALDAVPHLVDALEDRQHFEVRWAARYALQHWMSRHADHDLELFRLLQELTGYSRENAAIVLGLLHTFSEVAGADPKTYQTLIEYLNHDKLAVRELASWHLTLLAPHIAKDLLFDPAGTSEHRKQIQDAWKKRLRNGSISHSEHEK